MKAEGRAELRRLAYLEAMGVSAFVSRASLPGAAATCRLAVHRPRVSPAALRVPARSAGAPPVPEAIRADRRPPPSPAPVGRKPPSPQNVPVFAVAATFAGGWLWLDEIPAGRTAGRDHLHLLQSICLALGLPADPPVQEMFNWPLGAGGQLDQGVDAARAAFSGFVSGRLERLQPARTLVLGEWDSQWYEPSLLPAQAQKVSVSAWEMLRRPQLKRQAWSELKPLANAAS